MKKLTYENGHLVLRDSDGKLFWSSHVVDIKDCFGGYKEIILSGGMLIERDFNKEDKVFFLDNMAEIKE